MRSHVSSALPTTAITRPSPPAPATAQICHPTSVPFHIPFCLPPNDRSPNNSGSSPDLCMTPSQMLAQQRAAAALAAAASTNSGSPSAAASRYLIERKNSGSTNTSTSSSHTRSGTPVRSPILTAQAGTPAVLTPLATSPPPEAKTPPTERRIIWNQFRSSLEEALGRQKQLQQQKSQQKQSVDHQNSTEAAGQEPFRRRGYTTPCPRMKQPDPVSHPKQTTRSAPLPIEARNAILANEGLTRVRSFSVTSKGSIVKLGEGYLQKSPSFDRQSQRGSFSASNSQDSRQSSLTSDYGSVHSGAPSVTIGPNLPIIRGRKGSTTDIRVQVVGAEGVGKSTLLEHFMESHFDDDEIFVDDERHIVGGAGGPPLTPLTPKTAPLPQSQQLRHKHPSGSGQQSGVTAPGSLTSSISSSLSHLKGLMTSNDSSMADSAYRSGSRSNSSIIEHKLVSILVDGEQIELTFDISNEIDIRSRDAGGFCQVDTDKLKQCDALLIVYSVADRRSFELAAQMLTLSVLHYGYMGSPTSSSSSGRHFTFGSRGNLASFSDTMGHGGAPLIVLVGNKCDLTRARQVGSDEGRTLAARFDVKFIETSAQMDHHVDELLVGVSTQVRQKRKSWSSTTLLAPIDRSSLGQVSTDSTGYLRKSSLSPDSLSRTSLFYVEPSETLRVSSAKLSRRVSAGNPYTQRSPSASSESDGETPEKSSATNERSPGYDKSDNSDGPSDFCYPIRHLSTSTPAHHQSKWSNDRQHSSTSTASKQSRVRSLPGIRIAQHLLGRIIRKTSSGSHHNSCGVTAAAAAKKCSRSCENLNIM